MNVFPKARSRRGVFLVELIAVISISVVLLVLSVALIQSLLKMQRKGQEDLVTSTALNRLARVLRADAHGGTGARVEVLPEPFEGGGNPGRLEIEGAGGLVVSYTADPAGVLREETREGRRVTREIYRMPRGWGLRWAISDGPGQVVSAEISRPARAARGGEGLPLSTRIEAIVGRDRRYASGGRP